MHRRKVIRLVAKLISGNVCHSEDLLKAFRFSCTNQSDECCVLIKLKVQMYKRTLRYQIKQKGVMQSPQALP